MNQIDTILNRGVEEVIKRDHLEAVLKSGNKLRVKLGIDPTAPDLHLGHTVVLRKLRQFQNTGHKAILIIGDFTAQVGDPSGQSEARKHLTEKEIKSNLKHYLVIAGKVIDIKKTEVHYNSEWHKKAGLAAILELAKSATIQQVLKRADFRKRLEEDNDVSILETLYPLLQGYDSVAVKADVELGGSDQKLNLLMGRRVQRHFKMKEQDILTVPLIEGLDGTKKMSKSYGNYVSITEKPDEMFGKLMTVPDSLIKKYFETLTDLDRPKNMNSYEAKLLLAETIVGMYHSTAKAKKAREEWISVVSKRELPKKIPILKIDKEKDITALVVKAIGGSKSNAWRLIQKPNTVFYNDKNITNPREPMINTQDGDALRIGKRFIFRIKII